MLIIPGGASRGKRKGQKRNQKGSRIPAIRQFGWTREPFQSRHAYPSDQESGLGKLARANDTQAPIHLGVMSMCVL